MARQAIGAILNLEASFQVPETTEDLRPIPLDAHLPNPDDLASDRWSAAFDRRWVPSDALGSTRDGAGRSMAWMRVTTDLPADDQLLHRCWLAYLSDDLATDAVRAAHPQFAGTQHTTFTASLDHTIWYRRPMQADEWHLHDFSCHGYVGGRGLAIGHIFSLEGTHVATVAQEVLMRARERQD